jgi:hypothetical protein
MLANGDPDDVVAVEFLEACDLLFSILLSPEQFVANDTRLGKLDLALRFSQAWEAEWREKSIDFTARQAEPLFMASVTYRNLHLTVKGWSEGVRYFHSLFPYLVFTPKRMTQSCLESIFSRVRNHVQNPTLSEYDSILAAINLHLDVNIQIRKSSYHDDDQPSPAYFPSSSMTKNRKDGRSKKKGPTVPATALALSPTGAGASVSLSLAVYDVLSVFPCTRQVDDAVLCVIVPKIVSFLAPPTRKPRRPVFGPDRPTPC